MSLDAMLEVRKIGYTIIIATNIAEKGGEKRLPPFNNSQSIY